MPRVRRTLGQPSLILRFGALSLLLVLLLAALTGWQLQRVITQRAQANAKASGVVDINLALTAILQGGALQLGPAAGDKATQGSGLLNSPAVHRQFLSVQAWLPTGASVFSTRQADVGVAGPLPARLQAAAQGRTSFAVTGSARVHSDRFDRALLQGDDRVLVVDLPYWMSPGRTPDLVLELTMPYAPTAAAIRHDTRVVYECLAGGFLVLYLALFNLVASASRKLRRQSQANEDLALHDTLTGLPNRSLLHHEAERAIAAAPRKERRVALLLLDLDRFKEINDTLGHHHGDLLLQMVGPRLSSVLREEDTVARLGGDEFVVLLPDAGDVAAAEAVADRLLAVLSESFVVDEVDLDVGCSIGIAVTPEHGADFESLLQHADVAMYAAKTGQLGRQTYDPAQDVNTPQRLALLGELRRGVEGGQLRVHYQPKADLGSGDVTGVEALVRWEHPTLGLLPPDEFIPLAEHTGLIRPLTLVVLDEALAQARRWADAGRQLDVAVNVSARCLLDLEFPTEVAAALLRHGVPAGKLKLEITESTVMVDPDRALLVLQQLADLGTTLSINDFGTGYSSMAYLQRLPVHELKIDRSFVSRLSESTNAAIVASSIDLGRNLGLRVVAEGVEDLATWDRLGDLGCHSAQGYYLSRPVTAAEFDAWWDHRLTALPAV